MERSDDRIPKEVIVMYETTIQLNAINDVKDFVNTVMMFDYDIDLVSGRYAIDAKSIMGIFSLDLSKPIDLNIHAEDTNVDAVLEVLKPYMI
jgi:phosphocarrier protein HPr